MEYTRLGSSGLYVSRLALGTIPFGSGGGSEKISGLSRKEARHQIGEVPGHIREEIILTSKARMPVATGPTTPARAATT